MLVDWHSSVAFACGDILCCLFRWCRACKYVEYIEGYESVCASMSHVQHNTLTCVRTQERVYGVALMLSRATDRSGCSLAGRTCCSWEQVGK